MRGAPARAIQQLAGHRDLTTTQRYLRLSPAALDNAIRLLDGLGEPPPFWRHGGDGRRRNRELVAIEQVIGGERGFEPRAASASEPLEACRPLDPPTTEPRARKLAEREGFELTPIL
jgi:hypothetical protein